ncbi:MAG: dihydroorotase [Rectinemataceae bacterium]
MTEVLSGDRFAIAWPDDFHAHLRRGSAMRAYARRHALSFGRALAMPNTLPPIASGAEVAAYRAEIVSALEDGFTPLMAFKLLPGMDPQTVRACVAAGAIAGKYYPARSTTNSSDGLADPSEAVDALAAMEKAGIVLCVHAEEPSAPLLEREEAFIPVLERILVAHPRLKVVVEHVSSAALLDFVLSAPKNVAATVTAHHLLFTLDDLLGEAMDPHLYCKPILKPARERDALREAVLRGEEKLFFGSDSAPHPRAAKETTRAASGIYSSPTAVPALAGLFDSAGRIGELEPFLSRRGAVFYGLPPSAGCFWLERREWLVPDEIDGVVPMLAGKALGWRISPPSCGTEGK